MNPKISVIGLGKLGAPMLAVFAHKGFETVGMDLSSAIVEKIDKGISPYEEPQLQEFLSAHKDKYRATTDMADAVMNSDISFIIVPTPSGEDKTFQNDFLISALKEIGAALKSKQGYHCVVITSTVMPGSTEGVLKQTLEDASDRQVGPQLGLCYNPEFIALGTVVRDMLYPDMILIGESDKKAGDMLASVYEGSVNSDPEFQRMNWVSAELCKIAVNTYVTTKISYANMIADMCDHLPGADSDVVTSALGADSRIGKKYIKGAIGYGGPCFPRDNKAFAVLGQRLGVCTDLAVATDTVNDHQTKRLMKAISSVTKGGEKVGILGMSYKPGTPVIEESQGMDLARHLIDQGHGVYAFDPNAMENVTREAPKNLEAAPSAKHVVESAEVIVVMMPWAELAECAETIRGNSNIKAVIDPWRFFKSGSLGETIDHIHMGRGNWLP